MAYDMSRRKVHVLPAWVVRYPRSTWSVYLNRPHYLPYVPFLHGVISRAVKVHMLYFVVRTCLCSSRELFWVYLYSPILFRAVKLCIVQVLECQWFWTIFVQWLWEEKEGFHGALAAKLIKECQSEGAEHIYLVLVMQAYREQNLYYAIYVLLVLIHQLTQLLC